MLLKSGKKMVVYLIQHSHTDIGYTESQEEISTFHREYINGLTDRLSAGEHGTKWVCEGLWSVEQFLDNASDERREKFVRLVKSGDIGLSGSFLNMTEAISSDVMLDVLKSAHARINSLGLTAKCAMTADIDGYSAGYPDLMDAVGVKYLLSLVHTHHGAVPFEHPQTPFIWRGPQGGELFCWVGEHYNMGNWTGLEIERGTGMEDAIKKAEEKLPAYLDGLIEKGYSYDFCPITVSGVFTDNAPPSYEIAELVDRFNSLHGDEIEVKFCVLEDFFKRAEAIRGELPVLSGDWTDWWSDGIGSTPDALRLFRKAQRTYLMTKRLDPQSSLTDAETADKAARALVMFAEHTWGYFSSVSEPWDAYVSELEIKKISYAASADRLANENLSAVLAAHGKLPKCRAPWNTFRLVNPNDTEIDAVAAFYIPFGRDPSRSGSLISADGRSFPAQMKNGRLMTCVTLAPGEELTMTSSPEVFASPEITLENGIVTTPFYRFELDDEGRIVSITDIGSGELLTGDTGEAAFTPIYEVTPFSDRGCCGTRTDMGKSRSCPATKRYRAKPVSHRLTDNGGAFTVLELNYSLEGCSLAKVLITLYKTIKRFDVSVIMNKDSVWEPENLYMSLPFYRSGRDLFADKGGCIIRPGTDGLPNACAGFYSLMNGVAYCGNDFGVTVALTDAPLIRMGSLEDTSAPVCRGSAEDNHKPMYSWLMNNFWETNFKASLGGFHEFRFCVSSGRELARPADALRRAEILSSGAAAISLPD